MAEHFLSLGLGAAEHFSRDTKEEKEKVEQMKTEKARDAAYNSHKKGWVPGGHLETGHFVDGKGKEKRRSPSPSEADDDSRYVSSDSSSGREERLRSSPAERRRLEEIREDIDYLKLDDQGRVCRRQSFDENGRVKRR